MFLGIGAMKAFQKQWENKQVENTLEKQKEKSSPGHYYPKFVVK